MSVLAFILLICAAIILLALAALIRTAFLPKAPPPASSLAPERLESEAGVERALAALIQKPTVSFYDPGQEEEETFESLKAELPRLFPRVHSALELERVGSRGLLYTWRGHDPSLEPVILASHFDVVPADDAGLWKHAPFSGDIADGFVWGRGAQDIKLTMASILFSAERLLAEGFKPQRTILFAFGGDEEAGGRRGAGKIAALLEERGIRASFLLDEGGPVAVGMLSMADRPLALVGIAEKGYIDLQLEALGAGGHASMPPRKTATGRLARAVAAVEARPAPARLGYTVRSFLRGVIPYVSFPYRLLFGNLWLTAPLVKAAFGSAPTTNAFIRTTAAPTMFSGSRKENVLADKARAIINMRILPGESSAQTMRRITSIVAPFGVEAAPAHPEDVVEPLPESPVDHEGYRAIGAALAEAFPEAAPVPFLFSAGTDTKHYRRIAKAIYRLTPLAQTGADLAGIHGRDERVEIVNLRKCARFYRSLMRGL